MNKNIYSSQRIQQDHFQQSQSDSSNSDQQTVPRLHDPSVNNKKDFIIIAIIVIIATMSIVAVCVIGNHYFQTRSNRSNTQSKQQALNIQIKSYKYENQIVLTKIQQKKNHLDSLTDIQSFIDPSTNNVKTDQTNKPSQNHQLGQLTVLNYIQKGFAQKDLYNGNMSWSDTIVLKCQQGLIVNSASKISQGFYIQKTAYQDVNLMLERIDIPAQNIYSFQQIRQFLQKIQIQSQTIAVDHYNPLMLLIGISASSKGIYYNQQRNPQLLKQNLILNDVFPFAMPINKIDLIQKTGYDILITDDEKLVFQILFKQKRQIIAILILSQYKQIQTFMLRKMNVYKFSVGQECQARQFSIFTQISWQLQQKVFLLPATYIITLDYVNMPIKFQIKNYEDSLYSYKKSSCLKSSNERHKQYELGQDFIISNLPFEDLLVIKPKNDTRIRQSDHRQVIKFIQQFPAQSNIYLESGPYQILLLITYACHQKAHLFLNPSYRQTYLFNKNLVINELQRIQENSQLKYMQKYNLIVTSNLMNLDSLQFQRIFFIVAQNFLLNQTKYTGFKIVSDQLCQKSSLQPITNPSLNEGIYLLTKI